MIRLTEDSSSARDLSSEVYAWKLLCTSSSRLSDTVCRMWRSTISPVMANKTVSATEVESRIFVSSGRLENRAALFPRSRIAAFVDDRRVWVAVLVQMLGRDVSGLGDRDEGKGEPSSGTETVRSRNFSTSGSERS